MVKVWTKDRAASSFYLKARQRAHPGQVHASASGWALWWSRNQAAAGSAALLFDPSASESFFETTSTVTLVAGVSAKAFKSA